MTRRNRWIGSWEAVGAVQRQLAPGSVGYEVALMANAGLPDREIADITGIHVDELCEIYERELELGRHGRPAPG